MTSWSRPARNSARAQGIRRRDFFRQTLTAAAGVLAGPTILSSAARGADGRVSPAERITVGLIGSGRMGTGHLRYLSHHEQVEVVAVCDVDRTRREAARERVDEAAGERRPPGTYRDCALYNDYRELLARDDIDAVVIVTPDHWHSLMAVDAAKAGKDIYCEKPVSVTIEEGRRMVEAVRRYGRVFQTGTQYRSIPDVRRVCQFIRDGGLGRVKSVFTIYRNLTRYLADKRFQPYAHIVNADRCGREYVPLDFALPAEPVPEGLDWDRWVGPAPWRDYNQLYHSTPSEMVVPWCFADAFGTTASTQYFSHSADVLQWALGYERSGPVRIFHPSSGEFPTLTCRYADGTLLHLVEEWSQVKTLYRAVPDHARLAGLFGALFVGERGWLINNTNSGRIEGEPESLFDEMGFKVRRDVTTASNTHHANWLDCIRTRQPPSSDEEIGHRSASLAHVINIAFWTGQSLRWDPQKELFPDNAVANRLRRRAMRAPWRM